MTKFNESPKDKVIFEHADLENKGRRKAVKTIVGGVTAIAAYNLLPGKWGAPIIESVFLPAHAATSGEVVQPTSESNDGPVSITVGDPCDVTITSGDQVSGNIMFTVSGFVTPAVSGLPVDITIVTTGGPLAGTSSYPSSMTSLQTDSSGQFSLSLGSLGEWDTGTTRIDATTTVQGANGSATCGADVPEGGEV